MTRRTAVTTGRRALRTARCRAARAASPQGSGCGGGLRNGPGTSPGRRAARRSTERAAVLAHHVAEQGKRVVAFLDEPHALALKTDRKSTRLNSSHITI